MWKLSELSHQVQSLQTICTANGSSVAAACPHLFGLEVHGNAPALAMTYSRVRQACEGHLPKLDGPSSYRETALLWSTMDIKT